MPVAQDKLGLFVITYNRSKLLLKTLEYLANSQLAEFSITVQDNASTDDTVATVEKMKAVLPRLEVVTNKYNVGPNVNIMRAIETSDYEYTWVLCDDDDFDLSKIDDVLEVIEEGKVDLLHVGAHLSENWIQGGTFQTPQKLLDATYPFFKFASFTPCNIFRTELFVNDFIVKAYNNVGNAYPHMAYIIGMYQQQRLVYVAKQQIVVASESGQSYHLREWYIWWMKTCELLESTSKAAVKAAYLDQWKHNGVTTERSGFASIIKALAIVDNKEYVNFFVKKYFTWLDRINLLIFYKTGLIGIRDKLYWYKQGRKQKNIDNGIKK